MSKFKIIKQIHKGRNDIFIVKYNGRECLLKKSHKYKGHEKTESLKRQIDRMRQWREFGLSKVKAKRYKDGILKTYIRGKTLSKIIDKKGHFFSDKNKNKNSKELKALEKFVGKLVKSGYLIHDMKGPNLVFDGNKFQIIDSGPIKKYNKSSLNKEYEKILYVKWSKLLGSSNERKSLKSFLKKSVK